MKFPRAVLLALLAAAAFLPFLGRRDVVISHEARVVQTAREMAHSGWPWAARPVTVPDVRLGHLDGDETKGTVLRLLPDPDAPPLHVNPWLVPTLNNEVRLQKPPLPYWCAAALFRLAGHWSEALARVVPALLGALATFLVYDLARRVLGRRFALPAALVWVSSYFIPDEFRKVMADPYLAFFALASTWAWVRATASSSHRRLPLLLTFYLSTALGLLAKGPPLFIHLAIPIALYHVLHRRRPPGRIWMHLLGIALLVAITLPWPLYVVRHVPHAMEIWRYESVGEMTDNTENARPFWFYLPNLFQITLPWTAVWLTACALPLLRRRRQSPIGNRQSAILLFPLLWYALVVGFFSLVHLKKNAYLLPATPAQALLIAQGLVFLAAAARAAARRGNKNSPAGLLLGAQTLIPLGFAVALPFLIPRTALPLTGRLAAAIIPAALVAAALRQLARRRAAEWLLLLSIATVVVLVGFFNFVLTPRENARSPRPAADYIGLALRTDPTVTTLPARLPPEATLYLPIDVTYDPRATTILYLIDDPRDRAATDPASFAARLRDRHVTAATRVRIPGDPPRPRYKLFAVTVTPGAPKTLADATPAWP